MMIALLQIPYKTTRILHIMHFLKQSGISCFRQAFPQAFFFLMQCRKNKKNCKKRAFSNITDPITKGSTHVSAMQSPGVESGSAIVADERPYISKKNSRYGPFFAHWAMPYYLFQVAYTLANNENKVI